MLRKTQKITENSEKMQKNRKKFRKKLTKMHENVRRHENMRAAKI